MNRCYFLFFLLWGCTLAPTVTPLPTLTPTPQPTEIPVEVLNEWETLAPGLERRTYYPTPENEITQIVALRIDPTYYNFRAHYRPGEPLTAQEWGAELVGVTAFVNANFFTEANEIIGLLVSDGIAYGSPYTDRGGMFLVQNGQPRVRSNINEPYMGEPLEQAVQAFPMLVLDGSQAYYDNAPDRFTRRTVVAQDTDGRIILMVTPLFGLPLLDLSVYLPQTDMNIVNAFNLDGGGSTLMGIKVADQLEFPVTSLDPVPSVLAVYPR